MVGSEDIPLKRLIKEAKASHADVRIGKKGVTEEVIKEIKRRLNEHKVVKVKIGIEVEDRREFARLIAEKANAKLIEIRGYTFILAKKND
ncbi:YhbY family RNA-binding protein [Stygiolobus azoricus]|uniref:RNA-binding protein n=1 Tax=Stygiolobus azoricus TaxID=41675 RepID=A0A650CQN9_9CREN|nr:YhbY family RNA-binding protein [Stygiolobus azoricus]QGR20161.1 RNA-binding protein [Stygiolobus azoricus]